VKEGTWDVAVVGAGPAGALTARLAASAGLSTLLLDRRDFPRWKVCGACLNAAGVQVLRSAGLDGILEGSRALPLRGLRLSGWGGDAVVPLPGGVVLSRRALDLALVEAAAAAGAVLRKGAATDRGVDLDGVRVLAVRDDAGEGAVRARVVVDASGLGGLPRRGSPGPVTRPTNSARVGVGAVLGASGSCEAGWIRMFAGRGGYVGMVSQEDGTLDVAAALDRVWLRSHSGPEAAVAALVREAGGRLPEGSVLDGWQGTQALRRERIGVAEERLFRVGDAAGYVEPFTGEGIAWALTGSALLAPLVAAGARRWSPDLSRRWIALHRSVLGRRQRGCRAVAWTSRRPVLSAAAIRLSGRFPEIGALMARALSRAYPVEVT